MHPTTALVLALACALAAFMAHPTKRENFNWFGWTKSGAKWSSGTAGSNVVSFYKDINFAGPRKDYPIGAVQNSLSKGVFGLGGNKENDTYSSLKVPAGMQVQVWVDNDQKGATYTFPPGDYPDLRIQGFHDNISSLVVTKV